MLNILHAADFHLDSAFSALTPEQAAQCRREQRLALEKLAKLCEGCDLVLLSGDLFDSARIYRDTLDALKHFFASVDAECFVAAGNHDFLAPGSPYLSEQWGDNVHIFKGAGIERFRLAHLNCEIYGASFTAPEMPNLLRDFRVENPDAINLMVLHGELAAQSPYSPLSERDIAASGLDYLALGHVHTAQVQRFGRTACAYPGCLTGRGFDECGQKGALHVSLSKQECKTEFFPVADREYAVFSVDAGENPLIAAQNILSGGHQNDCCRVIFTGESDGIDLQALQAALEPLCFSLSLRDRTTPKTALWAGCGEDTLRGIALQRLKHEYDNADELRRETVIAAARLMTALMDGREAAL